MDTVSTTPRNLHSLLGTGQSPVILDVRRDKAYDADTRLIASALRPTG